MPAAHPDLLASIEAEAHVAIAVSGGSDSMALLRLAAAGLEKVTALTVDHGLREGSAAEARQVAAWCRGLGIEHHILNWRGEKPVTGIQAKARVARYDLMSAWCRKHGVSALLTAHTLDDQAETVLMRMARTSSLDSLAGIPREGRWKSVRLVRPLLGERREALQEYLRGLGQVWIEDPSNGDSRFERVRIRKALPALAEAGVTPQALAGLAAEAAAVTQALRAAALDWAISHTVEHGEGFCQLPAARLAAQPEALRNRILGLVIERYGGGRMPEPAELRLLGGWLATGQPGRRTLGGSIVVRRKREIVIGREPGRIDPEPVMVPASGEAIWDGRFEISARPGSRVVAASNAGPRPRRKDLPAFVQATLPALVEPGVLTVVRHFGGEGEGWARFRPLNSP